MFNFTRKIEYSLVALSELAKAWEQEGKPISARAIAQQYGLPGPLLMNLLKAMQKAEIVGSTRGANGGYYLARQPEQIRLAEVIEAVEGPVGLTPCCIEVEQRPAHKQQCEVNGCPMRRPLHRLHHQMVGILKAVTLADLVSCQVDVGVQEVGLDQYDQQLNRILDRHLQSSTVEES